MTCPHCGAADAAGRFCSACGQPLPASCPECQAPLVSSVKFCGECGTRVVGGTTAKQRTTEHDAGERRQLTVLFCDLVGSTELSGRLDPDPI